MQKISLPQNWTARAVSNFQEVPAEIQGREIPAQVPGCIHLDLLRENLIPDPYIGQNEWAVQWIGRTDWEFSTTFSVSEDALKEERVDLVCEGLDTIATIWVNGIEVGRSENMHVEARFSIKEHLKGGDNQLKIRFDSAVFYARSQRDKLGDLPHANSYKDQNGVCEPFHFIRKNACNFGWDWGPALITCGVWKAIRLEAWSVARIASVRPIVRVANEKVAVVDVEVELDCLVDFALPQTQKELEFWCLRVMLFDGESYTPLAEKDVKIHLAFNSVSLCITHPKLWMPHGYGEQTRHRLWVGIVDEVLREYDQNDQWEAKIGLRETQLDTSPDEIGAKWDVVINGQKIWCKGANWIPDDVFLPRANDPKRLRERLTQARDAGMNMIRVWGGGIYETDEFYSICDELGLLVWQDFLFACAAYSEDEETQKQIEAEARHNISRLAKHPSLVLWNGCNENIWGFFDWNWEKELGGRGWGGGYYFDLLPKLVKELAPETPYYPGSPYSGSMNIHPLADQYGPKHMWDTWNEVSHEHFRRYSPRFASEFGHQAPATYSTMVRAVGDDRDRYGDTMLVHQKAADGNNKLHSRLHEIFEPTDDFDDWLFLTQLVQARAMKTAVEWFRTRNSCSGALFWQLNDCWPVVSWAAIDGDGKEKPLYFAAKQFFGERLLTIQPDGEGLALWAHNDSDESWFGEGEIRLLTFEGEEKAKDGFKIFVPARELVRICDLNGFEPSNPHNQLLHASMELGEGDCFWFFDQDKNLEYPEPKYTVSINGNEVRIEAQTLIRDIYINADRFGGKAEFGLITLLPGAVWTNEIEGISPDELAKVDFSSRPIVYCANWFGKK